MPAVVDDDAPDVPGEDRVGGDEPGVLQHLLFGDGPAVVVPRIPAGFRRGKHSFFPGVGGGPAFHQGEAVGGGAEGDRRRIHFQAAVVPDLVTRGDSGEGFPGGSGDESGVFAAQRERNLERLVVPGDHRLIVAGEFPAVGARQLERLAAAHGEKLGQQMVGGEFRNFADGEDHFRARRMKPPGEGERKPVLPVGKNGEPPAPGVRFRHQFDAVHAVPHRSPAE
ncbi:hypothetical protein SDC9_161023 [bioreactor metagenome]|uniref:Uncharacterized protein n=1 Tax=bioreactor metagenome TaxID=1076179 RepID=A0A645FK33_9ZZZZ